MKILVGSVFSNDMGIQRRWLRLQLGYLGATTSNFEHIACITDHCEAGYFEKHTTVMMVKGNVRKKGAGWAHTVGLNAVADCFRERKEEFDAFLILDSDAFPIYVNWNVALIRRMRLKSRDVAAPLRLENVETRVHPSIIFALPESLAFLHFDVAKVGNDLLGDCECDPCMPEFEGRRRDSVFPLLRSNQYDIDPILCGVYYNMFYHHGAGSRRPRFRARWYWSDIKKAAMAARATELFRAPSKFIDRLAGWTPDLYGSVARVQNSGPSRSKPNC